MTKKHILTVLLALGAVLSFTGCDSVKDYSIRSYQGPMPMTEYQWMTAQNYGVHSAPAMPK